MLWVVSGAFEEVGDDEPLQKASEATDARTVLTTFILRTNERNLPIEVFEEMYRRRERHAMLYYRVPRPMRDMTQGQK